MLAGLAGAGLAAWLAVPGWAKGLALVALAGSGALLAVGGWARRVLGVLLAAVGLVLVGAGGYAAIDATAARPVAVAAGGAAVLVAGWLAVRFSGEWAVLGARFERGASAGVPETPKELWDALDRGEDPTVARL